MGVCAGVGVGVIGSGVGVGVGLTGSTGGVGVGAGVAPPQDEDGCCPGVLPSQDAGTLAGSKQLPERSHAQLGAAHVGRPSGTAPEISLPLRSSVVRLRSPEKTAAGREPDKPLLTSSSHSSELAWPSPSGRVPLRQPPPVETRIPVALGAASQLILSTRTASVYEVGRPPVKALASRSTMVVLMLSGRVPERRLLARWNASRGHL